MPISTQIGSSSLAKPGVCTSTTRPAAPYEGQMIYETDSDLIRIWNGTAWRTLAFATPTYGSILQVVTATTNIETTSNADSTYKDTTLQAIITPTSTSSRVLVQVVQAGVYVTTGNSENRAQLQLLRNGSGIFDFTGTLHQYSGTALIKIGQANCLYVDSPSSTSAVTYKTQFRNVFNGNAGVLVQAGTATSTIILQEISA